ncbi:MAG: hypothetical protein ACREMX_15275 [Gemmatimonadales bacterium]
MELAERPRGYGSTEALLRKAQSAACCTPPEGAPYTVHWSDDPWFVPVALAGSVLIAVGLGPLALEPRRNDVVRSASDAGAVEVEAPGTEVAAGALVLFAWRPVPGPRATAWSC